MDSAMEGSKELLSETVEAFKTGLRGEEYAPGSEDSPTPHRDTEVSNASSLSETRINGEIAVRTLYFAMLAAWNQRSGEAFAGIFTGEGVSIGFDGSQLIGRDEIAATLKQIFADHSTGSYVGIVKSVVLVAPDVILLRGVAGMVPAGSSELEQHLNSVQSSLAVKADGRWSIALLQDTPAQFHGRPEMARQLTEELQRVLDGQAE